MAEAFCVRCRRTTRLRDEQVVVTKYGQRRIEGVCDVCGTRMWVAQPSEPQGSSRLVAWGEDGEERQLRDLSLEELVRLRRDPSFEDQEPSYWQDVESEISERQREAQREARREERSRRITRAVVAVLVIAGLVFLISNFTVKERSAMEGDLRDAYLTGYYDGAVAESEDGDALWRIVGYIDGKASRPIHLYQVYGRAEYEDPFGDVYYTERLEPPEVWPTPTED